jgi:hypothetical protein
VIKQDVLAGPKGCDLRIAFARKLASHREVERQREFEKAENAELWLTLAINYPGGILAPAPPPFRHFKIAQLLLYSIPR